MCVFAYVPNLHHWFMYVPISVLVSVMGLTVTKSGCDMGDGIYCVVFMRAQASR